MRDYVKGNKQAWEEAFEHRHPGWGEDNARRLLQEHLPFFCPDVAKELETIDFTGKAVAQFCCNNGRELLSLMQLGAESGVGFDIAENILNQAETTAREAGVSNCAFVRGDILAIEPRYHGAFDFIFFTIGAITWFEDLVALFQKVADCLRPGGRMLLHDFHPFINMLPLPGEPAFDAEGAGRAAYSYFRKEPWVESMAAGYMAQAHETQETFISFSHTLSDIVNAACAAGMRITRLAEFDYDVGLTEAYNGKGWPLSMLLTAEKGL